MRTALFPFLDTEISKLGYGSFPLAGAFGAFDERAAERSIVDYLESGGNFLDTARAYGQAESVLGRVLRSWTGPRPILATKIKHQGPQHAWGVPVPVEQVFPRGSIVASVHASLNALGVDQIDVAQFHLYWPTWGVDGYWLDELEELRSQHLVRAIGVSTPDYRHDNALPLIASGRIDSVQTVINIFDPLALDNLVPLAAQSGVAVIARGVLDEGGLVDARQVGRQFEPGDLRKSFFSVVDPAEYDRRTDALRSYLPEHAPSLPALAINAVISHPAVTAAILSMPTPELVRLNVAAAEAPPLPEDVLHTLWTRHRWVRNFFESDYWK